MQGATTALVKSVAGRTGAVVLTADDVGDGTTNKAYSAADKTKLAGIGSGANAITGTTSGTVPVLQTGGVLATSVIPTLVLSKISDAGTAAAKNAGATAGANSGELVQAGTSGAVTVLGNLTLNSHLKTVSPLDATIGEFYSAVDELNGSVSATYITAAANAGRVYIGTSGKPAYSLNLSHIDTVEGLKALAVAGGSSQALSATIAGTGIIAGFGANNGNNLATLDYGVTGSYVSLITTYQGFRVATAASDILLAAGSGQTSVTGILNASTQLKAGTTVFMANQGGDPSTPTGGGLLYVVAGQLRYKGSSGTVTNLGNA